MPNSQPEPTAAAITAFTGHTIDSFETTFLLSKGGDADKKTEVKWKLVPRTKVYVVTLKRAKNRPNEVYSLATLGLQRTSSATLAKAWVGNIKLGNEASQVSAFPQNYTDPTAILAAINTAKDNIQFLKFDGKICKVRVVRSTHTKWTDDSERDDSNDEVGELGDNNFPDLLHDHDTEPPDAF